MGGFANLGDTKEKGHHDIDLERTQILVGYYATLVDPEKRDLIVMYFDPTCERETLSDKLIAKGKEMLYEGIKDKVMNKVKERLMADLKGRFASWWAKKTASEVIQTTGKTMLAAGTTTAITGTTSAIGASAIAVGATVAVGKVLDNQAK